MVGRGQAWSTDLIVGVLVFLLAIGTIYSVLNERNNEDPAPLRIESEVIANVLTSNTSTSTLAVAENNQIEITDLGELALRAQTDYEGLKRELGVEHEFCIYLQDEEGNLIYIEDSTGKRYTGIGPSSDDLNLTDTDLPCGATVT